MEGFVASVDRGRYGVLVGDRMVTAMQARELGHRGVVVGDQVALAGDTSGAPGTLARVVRVSPRTTALRRSADDTDPVERVIVANAEQLVIVTALADPPPRPRLIDRFLVAAYDAGLHLRKIEGVATVELNVFDLLLGDLMPVAVPDVLAHPLLQAVQAIDRRRAHAWEATPGTAGIPS